MDELIAFMPHGVPEALVSGVTVLRGGRFCAILSPREGAMVRLLPRARLESTLKRQKTLESLMQFGTVLPCAPDIVLSHAEAEQLLGTAEPFLEAMFEAFAGRAQYSLRIAWDEPQVLRKFAQSPEIAPLFEVRPSAKQLAQAVERLAQRLQGEMAALLEPVALDLREQPRAAPMIAHFAFLLQQGQEAALDDCLERIDALWAEGLTLRLIGPSPATCHGLLTVHRAAPKLVAQAAQTLGLPLDALSIEGIAAQKRKMLRGAGSLIGEADRLRDAAELLERSLAFAPEETVIWLEQLDSLQQMAAFRRAS